MTIEVGAKDRFIVCNRLRFHYREWGDAGAPPVVLLHGLRGHAHTWDNVAPVLVRHARVLALDQRGRGESDWTADYSLGAMADDLAAFAGALHLERFMLIGHSLGGRTAFVYLQRHPQSVERLVIEDIGPGIEASGDERIQIGIDAAAWQRFEDPEEALRVAIGASLGKAAEEIRRDTLANLIQDAGGRWRWRFDAAGLAAARRAQDGSSELKRFGTTEREAWEAVRDIGCPTLLVRGAESDVLGRETAEQVAKAIAGCAFVEVPASGHSVHVDNLTGYLAVVEPFIAATTL